MKLVLKKERRQNVELDKVLSNLTEQNREFAKSCEPDMKLGDVEELEHRVTHYLYLNRKAYKDIEKDPKDEKWENGWKKFKQDLFWKLLQAISQEEDKILLRWILTRTWKRDQFRAGQPKPFVMERNGLWELDSFLNEPKELQFGTVGSDTGWGEEDTGKKGPDMDWLNDPSEINEGIDWDEIDDTNEINEGIDWDETDEIDEESTDWEEEDTRETGPDRNRVEEDEDNYGVFDEWNEEEWG